MIPNTPHGTHSQAEKRVFDRLRAVFVDQHEGSYTVYHSLNLPQHAYKRFAEIDFLICCPMGLYVLESRVAESFVIKACGATVTVMVRSPSRSRARLNRRNQRCMPCWKICASSSPLRVIAQFSIGYGVIFPDCEWSVSGSEWDPHTLADIRSYKDLERWLGRLSLLRKSVPASSTSLLHSQATSKFWTDPLRRAPPG